MGKASVRLKDIADRTGFSVNTVSLALRDSPRIPEVTRQLIREAADRLHYLPNQIAKSLVSRETKTVGLVLTDITNPILTQAAQAIELALSERGYGTLFATSNNDSAEEIKVLEMFRSRQVDGMLIYPRSHRKLDHIRRLRAANYPIVLLVGDPDAGIDAVGVDERRGAYKATRHLIESGHTRIAIIDGARQLGNLEKRDGYLAALSEAGLSFDQRLAFEPTGFSVARGYEAMEALYAAGGRPTAVFAATDSLAIGALRWALTHALRVPDDIAIVGFDNIEFAEHAAIPISSVNYESEAVSTLAVERLLVLIAAGDTLPDPCVTQLEPDLIVRQSSAGAKASASDRRA